MPRSIGSCWPDEAQTLLLQACLLSGKPARQAWRQWERTVDIRSLDEGSFRLLPLLYHNLSRLGAGPDGLKLPKNRHRVVWSENMLLLHHLRPILTAFNRAAIPALLIKGLPLILSYYEHPGLRPMADMDVVVPKDRARQAWEILVGLGYSPKKHTRPVKEIIAHRHAWSFYGPQGQDVDLHWHSLLGAFLDKEFLDSALSVEVGGKPALTPCPADLLLQVLGHGAWWCKTPPFRWAADACTIIRKDPAAIDWNRLVRLARRSRLTLPVWDTLCFLREKLEAPVPEDCLEALAATPRSGLETRVYKTLTAPPPLRSPLPLLWYTLALHLKEQGLRGGAVWSFPGFLKHTWEIEAFWKVPFVAAFRGARSFLRKFRSTNNTVP